MPTIPLPVPASVLADRELARRKKLRRQKRKWNILTGCREIDEYVLLGGFERGSVVGVSSEDDEMGLLVSFLLFPFGWPDLRILDSEFSLEGFRAW